jgi:toxin-antitoxin system PIN domain toxin
VSVALDANILIYAANADDPRHGQARTVLAELAAGPEAVYLFWPVIMAFLRITTRPGLFPNPLTLGEAMAAVEDLLKRPHVRTNGESEQFWSSFRELAVEAQIRGDMVTDAHIVALMRSHGVRTILTRDRDFRRFDGIRVRDPFARPT